jgi:hypothetical protein
MDIEGDPSYLKDVARALSNLYDSLEDAHYGTIGHVVDDRGAKESVQENKKTIKEGVLDSDDEDGFMARSQLYFMARDAIKLHGVIQDQDDLEPWVQDKIASSSKDMDAVRRYTEYNAMKAEIEPEGMELSTHTHDEPVEEIPAEVSIEPAEESTVVETDYARDYVLANAPERMVGMHPVSKNAFLVDLEKTYPGIRLELGEAVVETKEVEVTEGMEFDDKNASDDLQVVAKDLFKSAMKAAQKKHKESKVVEGVAISGATPNTGSPHQDNTVKTVPGGTGSTVTGATPKPTKKNKVAKKKDNWKQNLNKSVVGKEIGKAVTKAQKLAHNLPKGGGLKQGSKAGRATAVTMPEGTTVSATRKPIPKAVTVSAGDKANADAQNKASDAKLIKKAPTKDVNRKRNYNDDGIAPPKGHHNNTSNRWAESTEEGVKS